MLENLQGVAIIMAGKWVVKPDPKSCRSMLGIPKLETAMVFREIL
jgi:hypothetical protein